MLLLVIEKMRDPLYEVVVDIFNSMKVGANSKRRLFSVSCPRCEKENE